MSLVEFSKVTEGIPNYTPEDAVIIKHLQAAAEATVESYCNRKFAPASYSEKIQGTGRKTLQVKQRPIISIQSIRFGLAPALAIQNTDNTNYNSTVVVSGCDITLNRYKNGLHYDDVLTYTDYPTIGSLNTKINTLGNGWYSTISNDPFSGWVSGDLGRFPGSFGTRLNTAFLNIHRYFLSDYRVNNNVGEIYSPYGFPRGYDRFLVEYIAGYGCIPADLQNCIVELVRNSHKAMFVNGNIISESLGDWSYTLATKRGFDSLSFNAMTALNYYRSLDLANWRI